jgi:hypothetical protein
MAQELTLTTGSEWHTSYGAYGKVKVLNGNEMVPHFKTDACETDWDNVTEVGYHGKHGKWIPAWLTLEEGTLIYVEGAETWRGRASKKGRGWFEVMADGPIVKVTTPGYSSRGLEVQGTLRRLDYAEMKDRDLEPTIRSSKHLLVEAA